MVVSSDHDIRLGFFGANVGAMVSPRSTEAAQLAEELGYHSMWTGEHVVLPKPRQERPPLDPDWPMADPLIMLSHLAAVTDRIELCTGVAILTQRHPVRFAKEAATLDVLSSGRLVLGLGLGHLGLEFEVLNLPADRKRARFNEYVAAMRELWIADEPQFHGEFVSFDHVDAHPRPHTRGGPRLVMGGYAEAGYELAAAIGAGWYGFGLLPEQVAPIVQDMRERVAKADREPADFIISVTPRVRLDAELVEQYRQVGVDQIVVSVETRDFDGIMRRLEHNQPKNLGIAV